MLIPLKQFICDTCGEIIQKPEDGWVEWISVYNESTKKFNTHSYRIVHHQSASPKKESSYYGCYQHDKAKGRCDNHLHHFINDEYQMANILSFLDVGPYHCNTFSGTGINDIREYVEFVRRLTIPYYEEARIYWQEALEDGYFEDANEIWIYGTKTLKQLIEKYGR